MVPRPTRGQRPSGSVTSMPSAPGAVFVDLDRTLIRSASGPVFHQAMEAEGVLSPGRRLPGDGLLYGFYGRFGETVPFIGLARAAAAVMRGRSAEATRRAGKRAVEPLLDLVQPWALEVLAAHQAEGRPLVMATTSPVDLVSPLADTLGFDGVIATRYAQRDGLYTGRLDGSFVWGVGKKVAAMRWVADHGLTMAASYAYSDSFFDLPLLRAVGHPHPVNADPRLYALAMVQRWPLDNWDRPPGIPSLIGFEPYHLARLLFRPQAFPYARFDIRGIDNIPPTGPVAFGLQPPELFRRGRPRGGGRPAWPAGALHGQAGGFRCSCGRPPGPDPRRHTGGAGQWLVGPDAPGRRRPAGGRGGHRPTPGHHPPWPGLLRPGPAGTDRRRPPGCRNGSAGHSCRPVGHRKGLASRLEGSRHDGPGPSTPGHRAGRAAGRSATAMTP